VTWMLAAVAYVVVGSSSFHSGSPYRRHCCPSPMAPWTSCFLLPSLSAAAAAAAVGLTMTSSTDAVTSSVDVMTS